jgi:hypothetical protein
MNKTQWRKKTGITDLIFGTWNVQTMLQPGKRCLDDVSTDLRKMGINEWRARAKDREAWRRTVHPGL